MRSFDLSPLFRNTVGFDRMARMLDSMASETQASYPPYNIEKLSESEYVITMAVAGFSLDDLEIMSHQNMLTVQGHMGQGHTDPANGNETPDERVFLHRGIAERSFERRFNLADHIKISGAKMENGMLNIYLMHEVPKYAKPRRIEITTDRLDKKSGKNIEANSKKSISGKAKVTVDAS